MVMKTKILSAVHSSAQKILAVLNPTKFESYSFSSDAVGLTEVKRLVLGETMKLIITNICC